MTDTKCAVCGVTITWKPWPAGRPKPSWLGDRDGYWLDPWGARTSVPHGRPDWERHEHAPAEPGPADHVVTVVFDVEGRLSQELAQRFWAEGDRFRAVGPARYEWTATKLADDPDAALERVRAQVDDFTSGNYRIVTLDVAPREEAKA